MNSGKKSIGKKLINPRKTGVCVWFDLQMTKVVVLFSSYTFLISKFYTNILPSCVGTLDNNSIWSLRSIKSLLDHLVCAWPWYEWRLVYMWKLKGHKRFIKICFWGTINIYSKMNEDIWSPRDLYRSKGLWNMNEWKYGPLSQWTKNNRVRTLENAPMNILVHHHVMFCFYRHEINVETSTCPSTWQVMWLHNGEP